MPTGDYHKYMPKFPGSRDYTIEEHIEAFYAYAANINISEEYVWTIILCRAWMVKPRSGSRNFQQIQCQELSS
jgi:hypothetical protein